MALGTIMSAAWILTSIAMVLAMVGMLAFHIAYLDTYDTAMIFQIIIITGLLCYSCHHFEQITKMEIIKAYQIG